MASGWQKPEKDERRYYTYILLYPEEMGGAVFYVGMGSGLRISVHETEAWGTYTRSAPKSEVIRTILARGYKVRREIVADCLTRDEALAKEAELVKQYGFENLANARFPGEHHEGYNLLPAAIRFPSPLRMKLEKVILNWLAEEGLEPTRENCKKYITQLCFQVLLDKLEKE